jgi:hypothetical protein
MSIGLSSNIGSYMVHKASIWIICKPLLGCPLAPEPIAKTDDHKVLFQWVEELDGLGDACHMEIGDEKGRRHHYRWVNQVPLNGGPDVDQVNSFEYWLTAFIK